jgi:uncharacterized protein YndB with AHSA1/START domain
MKVQFDSFEMTETFNCSVEKLFNAFTDPKTKRAWYADGSHAHTHTTDLYVMDASIGGKEVFHITLNENTPVPGTKIEMEAECMFRVDHQLLVLRSSMRSRRHVVSISNETFEFDAEAGGGAVLKLTQQGTYFEGSDGPQLRRNGHQQLFAHLRNHLGA